MNAKYIMLLFIALIYPFHTTNFGINLSFADPVIGILLLYCIIQSQSVEISRELIYYILLPTYALIMLLIGLLFNLYSPLDISAWLSEIIKLIASGIWGICIYISMKDQEMTEINGILSVFTTAGIIFSLWTIYESIINNVSRHSGPFQDPNLYGNYLILILVLILYLWAEKPKKGRRETFILIFSLSIVFLSILYTLSRSVIIALFISTSIIFIIFILSQKKVAISRYFQFTFLFISSVFLFLINRNLDIVRRIQNTSDYSTRTRLELWEIAIDAFVTNPFIGIGFGQFPIYSSDLTVVSSISYKVHNTYLSFGAELGLIGLFIFLYIFISIVRKSIYLLNTEETYIHLPILLYILSTLIQGLAINVEYFRSLWISVGLFGVIYLKISR